MLEHNDQKKPLASPRKPLATAIAAGLVAVLAQPVLAQGVIEELVVTAQKREENLQTTPLAISAMSGDSMAKMGITDFSGVVKASPALAFTPYPSSSNTLIMYIRGQGVSDPMQITADGSVGLYSDGFYISRPQSSTFDLADIERVEVLRGPQGTLYGRNTTGGAVNLISKKPTGEFGFKQSLTFGTRDYFRSLTSVNLPEVGGVATKFTILKSEKDGFVKNVGSSHDYGEEAQQGGRFSLHWDVAENFTVDYFFETGKLDSTPIYYQNTSLVGASFYGAPYTTKNGPQERTWRDIDLPLSKSDFEGHGLTLSWDVADNFTINSLTGYRELSFSSFQDYAEAFGIGFTTDDDISSHQFSQEFQFVGSALDDRLEYLVGLYYFEEGASHRQVLNQSIPGVGAFGSDRYVTSDAESKAIFAQATYTPAILDDRLSFTLGGRYTEDERSATRVFTQAGFLVEPSAAFPNNSNDQNFSKFNPSFTVNMNWNDDLSTYAKVVTGYKAGGSSESGPVGSFGMTFDPEEVTSYEVGMKSYWWDRRVRLNIAAYYSEFDDMQLAFVVSPTDSSIVQSQNAGSATVQGGEIELMVMPIDDLTFTLDISYLDAKFDEVEVLAGTIYDGGPGRPNEFSPYRVGDNIKDVFVMPYAPEKSVSLGAEYVAYRFDQGDVTVNLNYRWQDEQALTANAGGAVPFYKNYWQPSFGTLDARVTLSVDLPRGDSAKIGIWGRNILDKEYRTHVIGQGGSVASPNPFNPGTSVPAGYFTQAESWAEPAAYGIDLVYEY